MANMSAKFDEEAHNDLVSIVFISLFPYMSIVTLTFNLQNQQGPSSRYSKQVCQVWWQGTQQFSFYRVHKVKAWRTDPHTDGLIEPQQRYYIRSPHVVRDKKCNDSVYKSTNLIPERVVCWLWNWHLQLCTAPAPSILKHFTTVTLFIDNAWAIHLFLYLI